LGVDRWEQEEKDEPEEVVVVVVVVVEEDEDEERIYHVLKGFGCFWKCLGFGAVGESLH
jgi:predicted RNA-binding protein